MRTLMTLLFSGYISIVMAAIPDTIPVVRTSTVSPEEMLQNRLQRSFPLKDMFAPEVKLLFVGDIMGHTPQIESAYNRATRTYSYTDVWQEVAPLFKSVDWAIGNLEVTLGGKPYRGYPAFSSPDALASSLKDAGISVLVTANNHSLDRSKCGVIRTLDVLDSLNIQHTGTFRTPQERAKSNLLVLDKHEIRVGLMNYTYGTNGIPTPSGVVVNRIDTTQIALDIQKAQKLQPAIDYLILVFHWGNEYQQKPSKAQKKLSHWCFEHGVDAIIGSHPHVVQPIVHNPATGHLVVYSLGNFVSNQRTYPKDGGMMVQLHLIKQKNKTRLLKAGYELTWVDKYRDTRGELKYVVRRGDAQQLQQDKDSILRKLSPYNEVKMNRYLRGIGQFLEKTNQGVANAL